MADALTMPTSQESQASLKRDHDSFEFEGLGNITKPYPADCQSKNHLEAQPSHSQLQSQPQEQEASVPAATLPSTIETHDLQQRTSISRRSSTTSVLSDVGTATPSRGNTPLPNSSAPTHAPSPTQSAFAAMNGNGPPPAKKAKKLTYQEKEDRRILKEIKDQEKAEEQAKKAEERKAQAEDKAKRDAEKEAERKKRDAEKEEKRVKREAEEAAKKERMRKKEEERKAKEDEKQKAEEEKEKKKRSQKTLASFFVKPTAPGSAGRSSLSPAPSNSSLAGPPATGGSTTSTTSSKAEPSTYEKLFPPFFIQSNVTLAPINRFERDEEASAALEKTIDSYLFGNRSPGRERSFDAASLFHLPGPSKPRGKQVTSVETIMREILYGSYQPSSTNKKGNAFEQLQKIPLKYLEFDEEVRPPYCGTYTKLPRHGVRRLATNPTRHDLPDKNYDYDSEAEWLEEDGDDMKDVGDNNVDEAEDLDDFLEDDGDQVQAEKRVLQEGKFVTSGFKWEEHPLWFEEGVEGRNVQYNDKLVPFHMEFIDQKMTTIDPLCGEYWQRTPPKQMQPPRVPLNAFKVNSLAMNSSAKTANLFFTPASDIMKVEPSDAVASTHLQTPPFSKPVKPQKLLPDEDMEKFRNEVRNNEYNKQVLVGMLSKHLPGRTTGMIKATLDAYATRVGKKEIEKRWVLNDEMTS